MLRPRRLLFVVLVLVARGAWPQGSPVGPEFRVNTYTTDFQILPGVASDSSGNFVVVWTSNSEDGSGLGVFGQRFAGSGATVGTEFRVNSYTTSDQYLSAVSSDASGNFVVTWTSPGLEGSGGYGIFGQRYSNIGAPLGPQFHVNTYTTNSQSRPSIASDSLGNFVVTWESIGQDGSDWGVFGQRYVSSGAPVGPEFRINTYTTNAQRISSVASDGSGNFVVVWASYPGQDGSTFGVFGQRYASSGAPLGTEFRINTYTSDAQTGPSIALDASGNFVVVWTSYAQKGSNSGVFGQRYNSSGAPVGPEFHVNTYTAGYQFDPTVAADSTGNFVVVWVSSPGQDGSSYGVFGQRYSNSGAPLGPEFRVNTYTTDDQLDPAVAADSTGRFVVVWTSYPGQDGSSVGLFGQRYSQIVPVELMQFRVE